MEVTHVPLLQMQLSLYREPRSVGRFRAYLDRMTQGTGDMVLPLAAMNPMGKEHCVTAIERLVAFDAEAVAVAAAAEASVRLDGVPGSLRTALVLTDDVGGGWTDRHATEAQHRFDARGAVKRRWATVLMWTSEKPGAKEIETGLQESVYRTAYLARHGPPATLRAALRQEGLAQAFAGRSVAWPAGTDAAQVAEVMHAHGDVSAYPVLFSCMYGDAAATKLGYDALGLPERAGFVHALDAVVGSGEDPVAALR